MFICILHACAIVWESVGIWLVLFLRGGSVSKTFESFGDVVGDGEVHLSFL